MPDQQQRGPTTSQRDLVSQLLDVIQQQRLRQQQQQLSHPPSSKVSASLPSLTSSDWPTQSLLRSAIDNQAYTSSLPTSVTVPAAASTPSSWFPIVTVEPPTTVSLSVQSVGVVQQQHAQDGVGHCPTEQLQNAPLSPVQQAFLNFIYTVAASSQQQSTTTAPAATTPTQANMALSQLFLQSQHQTHTIPAPPPLSTSTTNPRETTLQNILVSAATLAPHLQRATLASLAAHVTQAYHDTYGGGTASAAAPIRQEPMPSAEAVPVATVHPVSHMPSAPQGPNITKVTLSDVAPSYGFSLGQSQYLPEASTSYGSHMFSGGMVQSVLLSTSTASPIASSSYETLQPQRHRRVFGISYSAPPEFAEEGTQLVLKYQQQITTAKKRTSSDMEQQQDGEAEEVEAQDGDANEDGSASAYTADTQLTHVREFAHKFKMRRLALGLTQTQVGRALTKAAGPSYSQSAICRFEKLDITKRSAQKIMPVLQGWLQNEERKLTKQPPPPPAMVMSVPSWSRTSSSLTGTSFAASSNEVEGPSSSQQTLKRSISESKSESFGTGKQSYLTVVGNASEEDYVDSPVLLDGDVADGGPSSGHSHNRSGKKRKRRTSFNPQALDVLNEFFAHNEHPSSREVSELADRLEYEREIIRVWFCNKRQAKKNAVRRLRGGLIGGGHRSSTMSFP